MSTEPQRQAKHVALVDAIQCIDGVIERADLLSAKINGAVLPEVGEIKRENILTPSLRDVLADGAEQINDKCRKLNDLLTLIEDAIF